MVRESYFLVRKVGIKVSTVKYMDEELVIRKGVDALIKELGPVESIRFINLPKRKRVESVKRQRQRQKRLDKDRFFNEAFGK
jgi:hypothetical protein